MHTTSAKLTSCRSSTTGENCCGSKSTTTVWKPPYGRRWPSWNVWSAVSADRPKRFQHRLLIPNPFRQYRQTNSRFVPPPPPPPQRPANDPARPVPRPRELTMSSSRAHHLRQLATTLILFMGLLFVGGCAPAYHCYSGCRVNCKYCPPRPLEYSSYCGCTCHSCQAQRYLAQHSTPVENANAAPETASRRAAPVESGRRK